MLSDIKLVIWDLDETFWDGTLSEGEIAPIAANIDKLRRLVDRGVMNSISSKNTFEDAQAKLEELEVWDKFVFPSIHWGPKGEQVRQIIERMKLRAVNVLFVDDNSLNREEVKFHNEGIHVLDPVDWVDVDVSAWGKDDSAHSRLNQYKLLEAKSEAVVAFSGSNENFLRQSDIQCRLTPLDLARHDLDRVVELLNRTNQLNFTKRRFKSGIMQLIYELRRAESTSYVVHVEDTYGQYGMCGFVSLTGAGVVQDFLFSCRLLDMGVERAILDHLRGQFPDMQVPFEAELPERQVDWVGITEKPLEADEAASEAHTGLKILMPTACFSETLAPFMMPEHRVEGLPDIAPLCSALVRQEKSASAMFWGEDLPELRALFAGEYDMLLLPLQIEVIFPVVKLPLIGRIPIPLYMNTEELRAHPDLLSLYRGALRNREEFFGRRLQEPKIRKQIQFLARISSWRGIGQRAMFSPKRYRADLQALRDRLPARTTLAISFDASGDDYPYLSGDWAVLNRHICQRMDQARQVARDFAAGRDDVVIIEPVTDIDADFGAGGDTIGHLSHKQTVQYARSLKVRIAEALGEEPVPPVAMTGS